MKWELIEQDGQHHLVIQVPARKTPSWPTGPRSVADVYQLRKGKNKGMYRGYVEAGPDIKVVIHKTLEGVKKLCEEEFIRGQLMRSD